MEPYQRPGLMEGMTGEIKLFAGDFVPRGWMICNGEILQQASYMKLHHILGYRYGGDGRSTFALPSLEPIISSNGTVVNYIICVQGFFPSRS